MIVCPLRAVGGSGEVMAIKVVRCVGCGHKVLEGTCDRSGFCLACMVDRLATDTSLEDALAEIAADERERALAKLDRDEAN